MGMNAERAELLDRWALQWGWLDGCPGSIGIPVLEALQGFWQVPGAAAPWDRDSTVWSSR